MGRKAVKHLEVRGHMEYGEEVEGTEETVELGDDG